MTSPSSVVGAVEHGLLPGIGDLMQGRRRGAEAELLHHEGEGRHIADILFRELHEVEEFEHERAEERIENLEAGGDRPAQDVASAARDEVISRIRSEFEAERDTRLAEEQRKVERMRVEFARDRQRFFAAAEAQVVRLALAVASRVLTKEIAADGLHLQATVKAALARVQDTSATLLRVPVDETNMWAEIFQQGTAGQLVVVGDERLRKGDCVLETNVGRVELAVDVQMGEIERGFGELLQGQPLNGPNVEREGLR